MTKIEDAGVKAVERLNILKAELIKDTVSHINSQVVQVDIKKYSGLRLPFIMEIIYKLLICMFSTHIKNSKRLK